MVNPFFLKVGTGLACTGKYVCSLFFFIDVYIKKKKEIYYKTNRALS